MTFVAPTPCLRWVVRDGKKVLQQMWLYQQTEREEWRDVPVELEEKQLEDGDD